MLKNRNGSTFVEIPNDRTTAKKCEYIFLTSHALFPSGIVLEAIMFENEESFLENCSVHSMSLGSYDIDIKQVDLYDMMHIEALKILTDFDICKTPKINKQDDQTMAARLPNPDGTPTKGPR